MTSDYQSTQQNSIKDTFSPISPKMKANTAQSGKYPDFKATSNQVDCYALVCGINDYPGSSNDLQYCVSDANSISNLLQTQFFVPESNIDCITNSDATKSTINSKITEIAGKMDSDDYFFFYFSGHGAATETVSSHTWSVQSPHPYSNNQNYYWHYSFPSAAAIRVHFTKIDIESNLYDIVYIGEAAHRDECWDYFSGYYTNVWSYWVETNDIYVELVTDSSYTYWGVQIDRVEVLVLEAPMSIVPYDFASYPLPTNELKSSIDQIPGYSIIVLDSCFSGGVGSDLAADKRYIMTACRDTEYSLEDDASESGVFTNAFVQNLEIEHDTNNDGASSIEEHFTGIASQTISRSQAMGYLHHPCQYDGIPGEIVLIPHVKVNSISLTGSTAAISYYHYGLGSGKIGVSLYDINSHGFQIPLIDNALISAPTLQTRSVQLPSNIQDYSAITVNLYAQYVEQPVISRKSYQISGDSFSSSDFDKDGITDNQEYTYGTNPWSSDSDSDGIPDLPELNAGLNPLYNDANFDYDEDTLPNWWEAIYGLNVFQPQFPSSDFDHDGLTDLQEFQYQTNPAKTDSDDDRLQDTDELFIYGTNPILSDTDSDGFNDGSELSLNHNPLNKWDSPLSEILLPLYFLIGILMFLFIGKKPRKQTLSQIEKKYKPHPTMRAKQVIYEKPIPAFAAYNPSRTIPNETAKFTPWYQQNEYPKIPVKTTPNYNPPAYNQFQTRTDLTKIKEQIICSFLPPDMIRQYLATPLYLRRSLDLNLIAVLEEALRTTPEQVRRAARFCPKCFHLLLNGICFYCQ